MQIFKMPPLKVLVSQKPFSQPITDTNEKAKPPPPTKVSITITHQSN